MCPDCGYYRTRQVVDIVAQQEKRQKRREERMKVAGEAIEQEAENEKASEREAQATDTEKKSGKSEA